MINLIRDKVKKFLKEALEATEIREEVRIIGIENTSSGGWIAEAEVIEKNLALPGHRVFEKKHYVVKLNKELEISSYKQVRDKRDEEG